MKKAKNFFQNLFFWNVNWFIVKIILILQKYLFWGYSERQTIKQSTPASNRGLSSNVWWLRDTNQVKFTKECVMFREKYVLLKRCFTHGLNISLSPWAWVEKTVHGVETCWHTGKEKFQMKRSVKKDMLTMIRDTKGLITINILEKDVIVNNASYCQVLRQNSSYLLNKPCRIWLFVNLFAFFHFPSVVQSEWQNSLNDKFFSW